MEESMVKLEGSVAAPMIFFIVVAVQYLSRYVEINMSVFFLIFTSFLDFLNLVYVNFTMICCLDTYLYMSACVCIL